MFSVIALFHFSLRFICKFEEWFWKKTKRDSSMICLILDNECTVKNEHNVQSRAEIIRFDLMEI